MREPARFGWIGRRRWMGWVCAFLVGGCGRLGFEVPDTESPPVAITVLEAGPPGDAGPTDAGPTDAGRYYPSDATMGVDAGGDDSGQPRDAGADGGADDAGLVYGCVDGGAPSLTIVSPEDGYTRVTPQQQQLQVLWTATALSGQVRLRVFDASMVYTTLTVPICAGVVSTPPLGDCSCTVELVSVSDPSVNSEITVDLVTN